MASLSDNKTAKIKFEDRRRNTITEAVAIRQQSSGFAGGEDCGVPIGRSGSRRKAIRAGTMIERVRITISPGLELTA